MYFIYLLLIIWTIFGIIALILPKLAKRFMVKWTTILPMWVWGIVALISAYVFFALSSFVSNPLIFKILAGIAFIKAIVCIVFPKVKTKWLNQSDWLYRVYGIIALVLAYYIYTLL